MYFFLCAGEPKNAKKEEEGGKSHPVSKHGVSA